MSVFVVTRGRRPVPPPTTPADELGIHVFYQFWLKRLHPYGELADGDVIYWADQRSREIRWEFRAANVRRMYCSDRSALDSGLRHWFGMFETDLEYDNDRDSGWLLAWENEVIRPIHGVVVPPGFRFSQSGIRELTSEERVELGLPKPGGKPLVATDRVDGPVPVFGPESRRSISMKLRREIFDRDGRKCKWCGTTEGTFHLDHIYPFSKGGSTEATNLQVLCKDCNLRKSAKTDQESVPEILLPSSAVEQLIVSVGRRRPETVKEAAVALIAAIKEGEVSVDQAGRAAMQTLKDVILDPDAAAEFSDAFEKVGAGDWALLFLVAPIDRLSYETLCGKLDEFVALALNGGEDTGYLAQHFLLLWTRIVETEMGESWLLEFGEPRESFLKWLDQVPDQALEKFKLGIQSSPGGAIFQHGRPFDSNIILSSPETALDGEYLLSAAHLLFQQDELDFSIEAAELAALSPLPWTSLRACAVLKVLLADRQGEGDSDLSLMYEQLAEKLIEALDL